MNTKKVAIFLAEGFEETECVAVWDVLKRAEIDVVGVSITGKKEVEGSHGINILADILINEMDIESFDSVFLPGGMPGTLNLKKSSAVIYAIKDFNSSGKIIAAICAAPIVLAAANVDNNKNVTSYPGHEKEFVNSNYSYDKVVVSENLITSRGVGTVLDFALKYTEKLTSRQKAEEIAKAILFNGYF